MPKMPIATATKPILSVSSRCRSCSERRRVHVGADQPQHDASTIIAIALTTEPCAPATAAIRPSTISEK